jgi:uncharacterized protein (DUF3084 family)
MKVKISLLACAWLAAASMAVAQTPPAAKPAAAPAKPAPAKPAAAPAKPASPAPAADKTLSLGDSSTATGAVLTREELRACFKQEESIRERFKATDATRATLDAEKAAIANDQQALRAERASVDGMKTRADEFSARIKAHSARVEDWQKRDAALNEATNRGSIWERKRKELDKERDEIAKSRTGLEAERASLAKDSEDLVRNYNAKVTSLDLEGRVTRWNESNAKWNDTVTSLEAERKNWVSDCAERRYREDDEKAIRSGK